MRVCEFEKCRVWVYICVMHTYDETNAPQVRVLFALEMHLVDAATVQDWYIVGFGHMCLACHVEFIVCNLTPSTAV